MHKSIQLHLRKDRGWLSWEWSVQYQESAGSQFASHMTLYQFVEIRFKWLKQWCWCAWSQKVEIQSFLLSICAYTFKIISHFYQQTFLITSVKQKHLSCCAFWSKLFWWQKHVHQQCDTLGLKFQNILSLRDRCSVAQCQHNEVQHYYWWIYYFSVLCHLHYLPANLRLVFVVALILSA